MPYARFCLLVASALSLATARLPATSYYVSNSGSDSVPLAQMSSTKPWKTLGKINGLSLVAGDRIYLDGGSTFNDAGLAILGPSDAGTAANPIIIDRYGSGVATIKPPVGQHGINIYNTGGVTVRNLTITGPGLTVSDRTPTYGVSLWSDQAGGVKNAGLRFENLIVTQFYQGIVIGTNSASFSGFKDVTITGCAINNCLSEGIVTYGATTGASSTKQSHQNLQILNTNVDNCKGDPTTTGEHSGSGIIMAGTLGGLIDGCVVHDCGGGSNDSSGGGPVGIWCWGCNAVIIQHCIVYNQKTTTGVSDGGGFDIDGGSTNCIVQYCYSYNNHGPGYEAVEFLNASPLSNATFRYNISWKDGRRSQSSLSVWNANSTAASCSGVKFYNNIVVSQDVAAVGNTLAIVNPAIGYPLWSNPVDVKFYNNIIYALGTSKLVDISYNTSSFTFKGNNYFSAANTPTWTWGATTYTNFLNWQAGAGTPEKNGSTSIGNYGDPGMVNPATGAAPQYVADLIAITAFIPSSTNFVINKGQNLTTSTYGSLNVGSADFKAASIPFGGAYDIGAYEKH